MSLSSTALAKRPLVGTGAPLPPSLLQGNPAPKPQPPLSPTEEPAPVEAQPGAHPALQAAPAGSQPATSLPSSRLAPFLTPGARESLYWYSLFSEHNNCWQSGEPAESKYSCKNVGANYLPAHVKEAGVAGDITIKPSGDYCNYYNLGEGLNTTDANKESAYTGYEPPAPLASYQQANHHQSVCQARETYFGHELRGAVNSNCTGAFAPCGTQHYVSLGEQELKDRPWSAGFGEPSLVISAQALPYSQSISVGGWGYICPLLEEAKTGDILEYCLSEWTHGSGFPNIPNYDAIGACASASGHNIDIAITAFAAGTTFAKQRAGSASTFTFNTNTEWRTFSAEITESNLRNAIAADNTACGRGLTSNPSEWALIGVEHGMEGGGLTEAGTAEGNLQLWTEYTHIAPVVSTSEATNVKEEAATLPGTVNPAGSDTHYYFQYGTTTSYGSNAPAPPGTDIGAGTAASSVSVGLTGLLENTTYHYRIVASNALGTSYGSDRTFKTSFTRTSPVALREAGTGYQWVYYVGKEHAVWEWTWNGSSWFNSRPGGFVAPNSNPTAVRDSASGNQWVYYDGGGDSAIWQGYWNGSTETQTHIGGEVAPKSSPVALREAGTGYQWVYYVAKSDSAISEWTWNGSSWFNSRPGGLVASGTSPAAVRDKSGSQWVYYVGGGDTSIWQANWNGATWTQARLGGEVAPGTNPIVLREEATGYQWVYYVNKSDRSIWEWTWNGSSWFQSRVGGFVAPNSTPTVVRESGTGYQWVYYVGGGDGAIWEWTWDGTKWVESRPGGLAASETSPSVVQPAGGSQWVYYQGSEDPITQLFWNGASWGNLAL